MYKESSKIEIKPPHTSKGKRGTVLRTNLVYVVVKFDDYVNPCAFTYSQIKLTPKSDFLYKLNEAYK